MVSAVLLTFIGYLALILVVTYYVSKQMSGIDIEEYEGEFYVGGRNLGVFVTAILISAGAVSAGTFIGFPGFIWEFGPPFGVYALAQIPQTLLLLGVLGKKIGIVSRRINANSVIDIIRARYEGYTPLILTLVLSILIFLEAYLSAELVGGAKVIQAVTGLPYLTGLLIFGGIIILYTTFGGLRGTGIIGIIQGTAMTVGVIAVFGGALLHTDHIFQTIATTNPKLMVPPGKGISWFYFISLWVVIGIGALGLPHPIQGALGYDSTKTLKQSITLGVLIVTIWTGLILIAGSAGKALNPSGIAADQNLPKLALSTLPGPLGGIVLAGIIGAAQTTIGSITILISSALIVNLYDEYLKPNATATQRKRVSIGATAAIGIVGLLLASAQPPLLEVIVVFAIGGMASSLAFPLLLGLYWPRTNKYGAFSGAIVGLFSYILMTEWAPSPISKSPIIPALILSFIFTAGISLLTREPSEDTLRVYFGSEPPAVETSLHDD